MLCSFKDFITEYLDACRRDSLIEFRKKLVCYDLVLLDNMQFAEGKTSTQCEFYELFSELLNLGKSVVIAWDRPVECLDILLKKMSEGQPHKCFIAELGNGDVELREKYIDELAEKFSLSVPKESRKEIAENEDISFAALYGALVKFEIFKIDGGGTV